MNTIMNTVAKSLHMTPNIPADRNTAATDAWSRRAVLCGLAASSLLLFASCDKQSGKGASASPIRIGVVLPLTGDAAVYGKAIQNGIELAKEEVGAEKMKIELIYEDDQGQPAKAVSATRKVLDIDKVPAIIGGAMSSTAEAMIPVTEAAKVVLISPTATKPSLTKPGQMFFRLWPSDDYDGKIMAEAAASKLKIKRVSILYINTAYGVGITEVFQREFQRLGGTIVSSEGYPQGNTDFRIMLTKIQEQNPEAVFLPGYVAEIGALLRQAREMGLKTRFLGVNSLYDPNLVATAGEAAEGAVFSYPTFDAKSADATVSSFVRNYQAKYKSDPDAFAAQGYDSFMVLYKALTNGTASSAGIEKGLRALGEHKGPGGDFHFEQNGDVQKPLRLLTIRSGAFVAFSP
jgi:branched-chain amino acid transport system substrate-binding protein